MEINFKKSLAWVRVSEGGNDDDPHDPGGRTSRGITQREYNAYCQMAGLPQGDVWKAPDPVVDDIYHKSYWLPYCPTMPAGVDYVFFDVCVNAGPGRAARTLQQGLGVADDGHIGMVTSAALSKADPKVLINTMSDKRLAFYRALPGYRFYGKGWNSRVAFARENALTLLT